MKRIHNAIRYLIKDTRYFFLYCFRYFQDSYRGQASFFTDDEIAESIKNGKSILRLGDGEIGLLHFNTSNYQKYSHAIRLDFLNIVKNYSNQSTYLLGIPIYVNYSNKELKELGINKLGLWMPLKTTFELLFNKKRNTSTRTCSTRIKKSKKSSFLISLQKKLF